jgi:PAS domain S-box-containing protein
VIAAIGVAVVACLAALALARVAARERAAAAAARREAEQARAAVPPAPAVPQEFFRAAFERIAEPLVLCDAAGHIVLVNAAARSMLRVEADPAEGSPLDWPDRIRLRDLEGRVLDPGEVPLFRALHGEYVRDEPLTIDGEAGRRRVLVSASPVLGPGGARLGAVAVTVDVTAAHANELALRTSEARYRAVVGGVDEAVFLSDETGRFTFLSDAFERWTGHPVSDAIGSPAWRFVHPDDRTAHAQAFAPLLAGSDRTLRHRHRYVTADGVVRWAEVRARLVPGSGVSGVIEDVTDRQRAEEYDVARDAVVDLLAGPCGDVPDTMDALLKTLCRLLEWDAGELWTLEDEALAPRQAWRARGVDARLAGAAVSLEVGDGAPGRAWALRRPVWVPDLAAEDDPWASAALARGARSALLVPVVNGRRVRALVTLLSRRAREPEPSAARALDALATRVALFLERADAERLIARQAVDLAELRTRLLAADTSV